MSQPPTAVRRAIHAALLGLDGDLRRHASAPVYLIGSAAACLAGAAVTVDDLDLLTSHADAERLERVWQAHRVGDYRPGDAQRFRSRFSRYAFTSMTVEVMGALQVRHGEHWRDVTIDAADALPDSIVRLPTIADQLRVLEMFGRPKDIERARCLRTLGQGAAS